MSYLFSRNSNENEMMECGNKQGRFPGEWGNEFSYGSVVGTQENIRKEWVDRSKVFETKRYTQEEIFIE